MVRAVNVQLYASEINTEKLIESKFYETLPISISNVLSNFLYLSPIFLVLEYSIIKIKRINLRKITLNLNRVLVVPYRSDFESFIAMRHFQAALSLNFTKATAYLTSTPLFPSSIFDVSLTLESLIMP